MMNMKKIGMAIVIILALMLSLSACGAGPRNGGSSPSKSATGDGNYEPEQSAAGPADMAGGDGGASAPNMEADASNGGGYGGDYDPYYDYSGGEQYIGIEETGRQLTDKHPEATFSLKVDTAAYSNVKRFLDGGMVPPVDAVRTEELINWFGYDEPLEFEKNSPFAFYTEVGPSPFDDENLLGLIRVGTKTVNKEELPPSNLVFLIDVSGSMSSYDKLPLLQNSFAMLTETLGKDDVVSIVTYASGTRVALSGARGSDTKRINNAIFDLDAGGSTAGERGIQLAYELAAEYFIDGGNNRVILATDGDFNVGISSTQSLSRFIADKRDTGVYLSVLGFGTGNIRDDIMETLAKDGNGNYSYIDSRKTAEKVLVDELGSNLFTVANDVKAQIVFNPDTVRSYRLIGYENRMLDKKDFDNDKKDAGEIGVGSDVIALFEIEPVDQDAAFSAKDNIFDVRVRYKDPGDSESRLIEFPVNGTRLLRKNTTDFGFASAVALFGDYLRNSKDYEPARADINRDMVRDLRDVHKMISLAEDNLGKDSSGYREDFIDLLYELLYL